MAQAVETIIEIDGRKIKAFTSLQLSQSIYAHHEFRLECFAEAIGENISTVFNESSDLIGATVHIQVTPVPEQSKLSFFGIITKVEAASLNGHPGSIVISGCSPTILFDQGLHCRSWMRKSINGMINDALDQVSADWLKRKIKAKYNGTIYYEVQYNETAWQFINRLAGTFGEWLYYDGEKLVLGERSDQKVNMTFGVQLSRFVLGVELRSGKLNSMASDYVTNQVYESLIEDLANKAGHNDIGAKALAKSEQLFGAQTKYWQYQSIRSKEQLDSAMSTRAIIQTSDIVRMTGCSDLPGLRPGDIIAVKKEEKVSDYRIISIEHQWDGTGNYTNEFVSIPASVKMPPVKPPKPPYCATQGAIVSNNYDDANLGRVRVRFHWMGAKEESPYLRMVSPYTGDGNGLFMLPETGAEVMVAFVDGNAASPYVIGVVYNGKTKTTFGNDGNDIKIIQTRSGIKILMNDKDGSIVMEDKSGNGVTMDGSGTVTMRSTGEMQLACGESKIVLNKDGTIEISGHEVKINGMGEVALKTNGYARIQAQTMVELKSDEIVLN